MGHSWSCPSTRQLPTLAGMTIASVRVAYQLLFGSVLCAQDNCGVRERGGHEDAKHRDDDGGTTQ